MARSGSRTVIFAALIGNGLMAITKLHGQVFIEVESWTGFGEASKPETA